jgi:hypothetical protein
MNSSFIPYTGYMYPSEVVQQVHNHGRSAEFLGLDRMNPYTTATITASITPTIGSSGQMFFSCLTDEFLTHRDRVIWQGKTYQANWVGHSAGYYQSTLRLVWGLP